MITVLQMLASFPGEIKRTGLKHRAGRGLSQSAAGSKDTITGYFFFFFFQ
jgi:hypothetical protein